MDIRALQPGDTMALGDFFDRIPEGDRTFFKEDVGDPATVAGWAQDLRDQRWLAVDGDDIVGYVAVVPGVGWSRHVGELRVVVDPARRGHGLGRALARRGLVTALDLGLTKVVVEAMVEQMPTVTLFQNLGFEPEALLKDHVRDRAGELHDLVVLAHAVNDNWAAMLTMGVDGAVDESG